MSTPRFIALALAATLSACASTPPLQAERAALARTPTELWKAEIAAQPEEIRLAVRAQGLSPNQAGALTTFADTWRSADGGEIIVQAPVGGPDPSAVSRSGESARTFLVEQGVPASAIRLLGYDAKGDAGAPLVVGFLRYALTIPDCGRTWTNISHSMANQVQPNFGCAVTANMAAQVANPADWARPRPIDPADAQRRAVVLEKYRKGELTSSEKDEKASGTVSLVVK
jgi:pilus assembly protein CpaD